ncbi:putative MFS family arabinose efflux permease [Leucobacter luti]|uniref:MFS transporter n=1 Tax=Leucobacter luti TaxID=340320 RepID=UPI0010E611D8|nr:MFS transporter [Leucobacter luti]MCW2287073.1 MFS family permease [Leucobacter luti]TCK41297.1 putative MFS family arabinose efflux permease [Leucobacter luti]
MHTASAAFWGNHTRKVVIITTFAFLVTMMGTTIPTPLYAIYATELSFTPLTVTVLFADYALGVVGALLLFGRLSDEIGRRPVMLIAVGCAFLSAALFLSPPSLPLLIVARVISGLGAGLMSGTGTAAIIDLFPADKKSRAATIAVTANTGGLALGTLLAGVLASTSSAPLVTPFVVHLVLAGVALVALTRGTSIPTSRGKFRIRPQRLSVPRSIRRPFIRSVLSAGTGFATAGVLTAVSGLFLSQQLGLPSHAMAGFVVFLTFAGMAFGQLWARRIRPSAAVPIGCAGLALGAGLLSVALSGETVLPLIIAAAILGLASGLCLNAGLAATVEQVPATERGSLSSAFFAGLYLMLALPAIGVGLLAASTGLIAAGLIFSALTAAAAIALGVLALSGR